MSNDRSSPISIPSHRRQSSLSPPPSFADPFFKPPIHPAPPSLPSSMVTPATNAQSTQQRRLSLNTLGLSGSPTQISPLASSRLFRPASISSSVGSNSVNPEEALIDEDNENVPPNDGAHSPFGRRLSSSARTLHETHGGSTDGRNPSPGSRMPEGRRSSLSASTFPFHTSSGSAAPNTSKVFPQNDISNLTRRHLGEGFNWSKALRTRAERAPSLGSIPPNVHSHPIGAGQNDYQQRATSIASTEQPARNIPKHHKQKKPDFFQEKILRGDFID
ncbi:hypothetical protein MPDQ_003866 [Monascus purpureus]|uniref:Uncharacterized protein n=1 Tax=Monascus purpureus TaxID=5098 RepID=A0A507QI86_MONPU|nr:hypothetical protein MPDQ_003866 [Monascus purpureus]